MTTISATSILSSVHAVTGDRLDTLRHERLLALLDYEPQTGNFVWLENRPGGAKKRDIAGGKPKVNGYIYISIDGRRYLASRLAWFYANKKWPVNFIDHINGDRSDNRLCNLREATVAQNGANSKVRSKHGVKGVKCIGNRFAAQITIGGKNKYLGLFKTIEEASEAYKEASAKFFGEFSRT